MLNLCDLIVEIDGALDTDFCESVINRFEEDPRIKAGVSGSGLDETIKKSTDLHLSTVDGWKDIDTAFYDALFPHSREYYSFLKKELGMVSVYGDSLCDSGYQIQKTSPEGFYAWHTDDAYFFVRDTDTVPTSSNRIYQSSVGYERRIYTYIFYLNDVTDGGRTQFRLGGDEYYSVTPKAGKLILFPANSFYNHRGEVLNSGVKYLSTGWVSDYVVYATKRSSSYSQSMRNVIVENGGTLRNA